jgi:hypothetical protein
MAITTAQQVKITRGRKSNPPSFFNSATGETESISTYTEGALILIGSSVKQKATQYLDILLETNPSKDDYDVITARAAQKQLDNTSTMLSELEPVVSKFEGFRDELLGAGSLDTVYSEGMYPLLLSITRGVSTITNRIESARLAKKINRLAAAKYASNLTDAQRKEWRSWKRVLLAYP